MDEYLRTMENYSPISSATGKMMGEEEIVEVKGVPQTTSIKDEDNIPEDAPYMALKTIVVKRYTLKK